MTKLSLSPILIFAAVSLFLLPLKPEWFAGIATVFGLYRLARFEHLPFAKPLPVLIMVSSLLGAVPQFFVRFETPLPEPCKSDQANTGKNRVFSNDLNSLRGWNPNDTPGTLARHQGNGFWRLERINQRTNLPHSEFVSFTTYPLEAGRSYTVSFYLRHDGAVLDFNIIFFTNQEPVAIKPTFSQENAGIVRAWATYTARDGDKRVRAFDLAHFGGDWTHLDVACVQFEEGSQPTAYTLGPSREPSPWNRVGWWISELLLGLLVFLGSRWLLGHLPPQWPGWLVVCGLVVHLLIALTQPPPVGEPRVTGLTAQANLLGAWGVVGAALALVLFGNIRAGVAIALGFAFSVVSASRMSFIGVAGLLFLGLAYLPRKLLPWAMVLSGIVVWSVLVQPNWLGRLSTVADIENESTQTRLQIWEVANKAWQEHPWTGIGVHRFAQYYLEHPPESPIEPAAGHAHNLFLNLLAEMGWPGLVGFAVLWIYIIFWLINRRRWGGLGVLAIALLVNLGDYTFFSGGVYYSVWVALAWSSLPATRK